MIKNRLDLGGCHRKDSHDRGQDCERYFCGWGCSHDRNHEGIEIEIVVLADTNEVILGSHSTAPLHPPLGTLSGSPSPGASLAEVN